MIVLDASVLIAHFEAADANHDAATNLLAAHALEPFAASVVTLAEVYVGAARANQADRLEQLLDLLGVQSLDLPAGAARHLGELRAQYPQYQITGEPPEAEEELEKLAWENLVLLEDAKMKKPSKSTSTSKANTSTLSTLLMAPPTLIST